MAELTAHTRQTLKVPSGGRWFTNKRPALELLTNEDQFVVAWDKNKEGAKVFGIYTTFEDFWTHYLKNKPDERWGYEIVLHDKPVKFHMDIEYWTDEPDSEHTKIRMVTAWRRHCLTSLYKRQPEIYVMCGTRPDNGKIKNSYHLVIDNYVCANNKEDGTMKEIYRIMQGLGDEWQTIKPGKDKPQCIVDDSICSADRCMRLLLSSKLGKNYPFYCLTEDAITMTSFASHKIPTTCTTQSCSTSQTQTKTGTAYSLSSSRARLRRSRGLSESGPSESGGSW